jgi:hypothetical protein
MAADLAAMPRTGLTVQINRTEAATYNGRRCRTAARRTSS